MELSVLPPFIAFKASSLSEQQLTVERSKARTDELKSGRACNVAHERRAHKSMITNSEDVSMTYSEMFGGCREIEENVSMIWCRDAGPGKSEVLLPCLLQGSRHELSRFVI